jgi:hypothetical protein
MISETARKFLDVSAHRKDKIELVFDFGALLSIFSKAG